MTRATPADPSSASSVDPSTSAIPAAAAHPRSTSPSPASSPSPFTDQTRQPAPASRSPALDIPKSRSAANLSPRSANWDTSSSLRIDVPGQPRHGRLSVDHTSDYDHMSRYVSHNGIMISVASTWRRRTLSSALLVGSCSTCSIELQSAQRCHACNLSTRTAVPTANA